MLIKFAQQFLCGTCFILARCSMQVFLALLSFLPANRKSKILENADPFKRLWLRNDVYTFRALQWQELVMWPQLDASRTGEGPAGDEVGKSALAARQQPSNNSVLGTEDCTFFGYYSCHSLPL